MPVQKQHFCPVPFWPAPFWNKYTCGPLCDNGPCLFNHAHLVLKGIFLLKMMMFAVLAISVFLVVITLASMVESHLWWVRMWDFPRLAIALSAIIVWIAAFNVLQGPARLPVLAALTFVACWQAYKIYPYTPLGHQEVAFIEGEKEAEQGHCATFMNLNVYQYNTDYARAAAMIKKYDPDILLLLETDQKWADGLTDILENYPHQTLQPQDNTYGLLFLSKLEVDRAEIQMLVEQDVPSIFAWMRMPSGRKFHFIGLHPKPPQPGNHTTERDAEIAIAAEIANHEKLPVVAMGDFNDVAWSKTSKLFKRLGTYLDPRLGRGFYATFPANWPVLRWPLDHVFLTKDFAVRSIDVLGNVGSDHLPVLVDLCLTPTKAERINEEPDAITAEDREDADEIIADAVEKQIEEDNQTQISDVK